MGPFAYDCVNLVVVRSGSAILFSEFGQKPVRVGDAVILGTSQESFATRGRARLAVGEYIEVFYNRKRPHSTIGYQTPAEAMAAFFDRTAPELPAVAA